MAVASLFEELLDQYKIEQRLAEKRYTDLYQAYDVDDDRLVRLDILRPGQAEDNGFAGRLVHRARAVAQVRHPRIAPIYHIGKTPDGRPYVAQAHIDGLPLSQRLEQLAQRETPVNALYALKLVRQLADALVLAERLELLHHDLQPDNIWLKNVALSSDESLVLLDLFIPPDRRPAAADGREDYRPPEQRAGREISAAGHVYSLGVLLYQLLAGRLPEGPVTLRAVTLSRLRARPSSLERVRPGLSRQTYDLVERCLRRDPAQRYDSVETFLVALDDAVAAEETHLSLGAGRPAESRRSLGWLLPVLIFLLVATVAVSAARWQRQTAALASPTGIPVVGADTTSANAPTVDTPTPALSPTAAATAAATAEATVTVAASPPATGSIFGPGQVDGSTLAAGAAHSYLVQGRPFEPIILFVEPQNELDVALAAYSGDLSGQTTPEGVTALAAADNALAGRPEILVLSPESAGLYTFVVRAVSREGSFVAHLFDLTTPAPGVAIQQAEALDAGTEKVFTVASNGARPVIAVADPSDLSDIALDIMGADGVLLTTANYSGPGGAETGYVLPLGATSLSVKVREVSGGASAFQIVVITLQ